MKNQTERGLRAELEQVQARLAESEATIKAIHSGEVDAIVVDGPQGSRIFTLRSPGEPYRLLAERMNEGTAALTSEGTLLFCNRRLAEMVGRPAERLLGSSIVSILREEERQGFAAMVRLALETDVRADCHLLRDDGTMFPVQLSLSQIPLEEFGQSICLVATDLSNRKRAEERLRLQAAALEAAANSIVITDQKGTILWTNPAFSELTGYAAEEARGRNPNLLKSGKQDKALYANLWKTITAGEVWHGEIINRRKDGTLYTEEMTVTPVRSDSGEISHYVAIKQDITERKNVEKQLRESEASFRLLFMNNPQPMWVYDLKTLEFLEVNDAAISHYGYSRDEFLRMRISDIRPEQDLPGLLESVRKGQSELQHSGHWRHRLKDGQIINVEITSHALQFAGRDAKLVVANDVTERKQAEEALRQSEERFRQAFEGSPVGIVLVGLDYRIFQVNRTLCEMLGYSEQELIGRRPADLTHPEDADLGAKLVEEVLKGEISHQQFEKRYLKKNAQVFWAQLDVTLICDATGKPVCALEMIVDVTERKRAQEALRQAEEKYRRIFEDAVVGIFQTTPEGRFLSVNPALAQIYGYESPEQLMTGVTDVARQLFVKPDRYGEVTQLLEQHGVARNIESEVYCKDGSKKWILVNVHGVRGADGKILRREGTIQDITERKTAEAQVKFLAYYDALSGLPNRTLFQDRLGKALASARRRREKVALLFLDLDRFKTINDSLGHSVGDLFLKEVGERLKKFARGQDTVARLGGDEFVVVLTAIKDPADAAVAADRIMKEMTTAFVVQEHVLSVTCSLGISVFPDHGTDGDTLLKNADSAMYSAKEDGNSIQFFTQDMNARAVERLTLENSLRVALERKELFLVYQPQVELATGKIIGAEALLRWRHPELGLVPPNKFIPIAENSGLIIPIGEWVLRTACGQARQWQDEGLPALSVAVNVSAVQFRQESFPQVIEKVLHETGLPPQYLELELTESLLLSNSDVMLSALRELNGRGVKLSIDDFGTGYSSLSYLRQFPVYKLKIDRSFVQAMTADSDGAAIAATIISMAKSLHLTAIAEGVETEQQIMFLRAHNCDEVQGYYFSRPLAAVDFAEKLRSTPFLQSGLQTTAPALPGKRWAKLQLAREALSYSSRNSRIIMEIFLLNEKRLIDSLLANRANTTQMISELVAKLEGQCDSEQEKQLLAAVNNSRTPYVASHLKALHLLDEGKQEAARAIVVQESTPALFKYHDAWNNFIQFQMAEMDKAAKQSSSLAPRELVPLPFP